MSLVPSLLQAIVKVDGEAMVMHAGDKPYVVWPTGQIELASRGLTLEAVNGIVGQLLPTEIQNALDEFGAIQYELPAIAEFPGEHFTVVAARGGDDVWVEIRRRRIVEDDRVPEEFFAPTAAGAPAPAVATLPPPPVPVPPMVPIDHAAISAIDDDAISAIDEPRIEHPVAHAEVTAPVLSERPVARVEGPVLSERPSARVEASSEDDTITLDDDLLLPDATQLWPARKQAARERVHEQPNEAIDLTGIDEIDVDAEPAPSEARASTRVEAPPPAAAPPPPPPPPPAPVAVAPPPVQAGTPRAVPPPPPPQVEPRAPSEAPASMRVEEPVPSDVLASTRVEEPVASEVRASTRVEEPVRAAAPRTVPPPVERPAPHVIAPAASVAEPPAATVAEPAASLVEPPVSSFVEPPTPAVVLPIARSPIRAEAPPPLVSDVTLSGLEGLLRLSSARGASTLYLSSDSRPSVRVDGELQMLDGEPVHTSRDVESLLLTLMPERSHEALRTGALTEWITDIEGVGRVRCVSFRDHRGPGGVFRLMPTRSVSVEQLGLPRHVQSLAIEPEGLVLVAGPRSSGKRTLMAAFVDLMNRTRRDHIITIEREINIVHERGNSFISQREVRGNDDEMLAAARGALREDPDVLMIEDLRTGGLMNVALEAAASGHLVVGGFSAHTATGAIDRIIDLYAPEYRRQVQFALADSLRGVIVQVLLKKIGGGRLPAREVLLNTPAVSSVIAEGKTSQLPMAIEGGRRYGMMPLNDALVGLVQNGAVEARDAYRQSTDRPGFLAALNRQGIDTSFVERLA